MLDQFEIVFYMNVQATYSYTAKLLFYQSPTLHSDCLVMTRWLDSDGIVTTADSRVYTVD